MRIWFILLALTVPASAWSAQTFVYVSLAPEKQIQAFRLDPESGDLAHVQTVSLEGTPGAMAISPDQTTLIVSVRSSSQLASLGRNPQTGKLSLESSVDLPAGSNAAHVACDPTGRWVLSASYAGGMVFVHPLQGSRIGVPAVQQIATARTAHFVALDPRNPRVYVPHVAPNHIEQFDWNAKQGTLTRRESAPGGTPGAGPRHLAFHPVLPMAYSSDEQGSSITAYRVDPTAGLQPVQTLSTLPEGFSGSNTTAEVKVHPSGRYVWVSNRGHDSLAGFRIDSRTGLVSAAGHTPVEKTPRSFAIDPTGNYVLSAGEGTGRLAVDRVNPETGALQRLQIFPVGKSLPWVQIVRDEKRP